MARSFSAIPIHRLLSIRLYPQGPRVWLLDQRVHHGASGCLLLLAGAATRRRPVVAAALLLATHDRRDWRVWFARERS